MTKENTICFALNGHKYRDISQKLNQVQLKEKFHFVSLVPIFQTLNYFQLNAIVTSILSKTFEINQKVFNEGDGNVEIANMGDMIIRINKIDKSTKTLELKVQKEFVIK